MGRRGDIDVVFVHAKSEEERFVAEGFGVRRYPAVYNDFFLVGPRNDPAGVGKLSGIVEAFRSIKEKGAANIAGATRTMTTAISLETSKGDLALALSLGIVLLTLTLTINSAAGIRTNLGWSGRASNL